ncbi:BcsE family c-di-GMP-binding protein [Escherichia coli]
MLLACGADGHPVECATLPLSDDDRKRCKGRSCCYVPEDITTLLSMTQPLKLRGFQKWDVFCNAVNNMMNNPLITCPR